MDPNHPPCHPATHTYKSKKGQNLSSGAFGANPPFPKHLLIPPHPVGQTRNTSLDGTPEGTKQYKEAAQRHGGSKKPPEKASACQYVRPGSEKTTKGSQRVMLGMSSMSEDHLPARVESPLCTSTTTLRQRSSAQTRLCLHATGKRLLGFGPHYSNICWKSQRNALHSQVDGESLHCVACHAVLLGHTSQEKPPYSPLKKTQMEPRN